jgi:hypothetical protein
MRHLKQVDASENALWNPSWECKKLIDHDNLRMLRKGQPSLTLSKLSLDNGTLWKIMLFA